MKRYSVLFAGVVGLIGLMLLLPTFEAGQPAGISISRNQARTIADEAATRLGIPVEDAWSTLVWDQSFLLHKELGDDPELLEQAWDDPVLGPRLGGFMAIYWRRGLEKYPTWGHVIVGRDGKVIEARKFARVEDEGASPTEANLRLAADEFLRSRKIPGVVSPTFELARPNVLRARTDHTLRYKVALELPLDNVAAFVNVHFIGDEFAGWSLHEEYADGSQFRFEGGR